MKPLSIEEFTKYLKIEKLSLDNELVEHSSLLFAVGDAYAEAAAKRDAFKEQLSTMDALLDSEVRRDLEKSGERVTEALVKSNIQTHKKHKAAYDAFADAKLRADKLLALKEAFHSRGYAIRDLCQLFVANYYEQNAVKGTDRTDTAAYQQRREKIDEKRRERIKE